jgi:aquaporin Z
MQPILKQCINEFLGTFLLCFVVLTTHNYLAIGTALALAALIFKGSFNPAVSVALLLNKELGSKDIVVYIVVEIVAAIAAYHASKLVFSRQGR